ncbi:hypothetical protein [Streptomyces sp. R08]|uniref:Head-to-tail connector complex protein n=1 Tax=Streptomyces sp. R08 TaxID=3238624 RepID=A0AB39MF51_9ACTN
MLDMVSAIVRREARQLFTRKQTTATLYPSCGKVSLPQRPVVSVDAVEGADGWTLRRDTLYVGNADEVRVTYTHGYAETPGDVKAVVLSAATRVLTNPLDIRQEAAGSMSVTYAAETIGASLSPADKDLLRDYRRRTAVVLVGA